MLRKLPDFHGNKSTDSKQIDKTSEKSTNLDEIAEKTTTCATETETESKSGKTLFSTYPEGDSRLVYRKYKSNAVAIGENRIFAGYLVNLQKLTKGNNSTLKQYYSHQENMSSHESYVKQGHSHLIFSSSFESGNLFAAFQVASHNFEHNEKFSGFDLDFSE